MQKEQAQRYSRHLLLDGFGEGGQQKLSAARILVIGSGGLGSPVLYYLAAAGVGTLGIADDDRVDLSNLQRQIIHFTSDIGGLKTQSAAAKIGLINPEVAVKLHPDRITVENIMDTIEPYDFVIDGTDNFFSKFLINDACVLSRKPFVHAGVLRFEGQMMTVIPNRSACYRCVFPGAPAPGAVPGSSKVGVLGSLAGTFGALQATETLKFITGQGDLLTNRLLLGDLLKMKFRQVKTRRRPGCAVCGENPKIKSLVDYEKMVGQL